MLILEYVFSVKSLCQLHFVMSQCVSFPYLNLTIQCKHYEYKPRSYYMYNVSSFQPESRIIYIKTAQKRNTSVHFVNILSIYLCHIQKRVLQNRFLFDVNCLAILAVKLNTPFVLD